MSFSRNLKKQIFKTGNGEKFSKKRIKSIPE